MKGLKVKSSFIVSVILLGTASFIILSWRHDAMCFAPYEYVKWVKNPDNGLNVTKKMNNVVFTLQYEPTAFLVANSERDPNLKTTVLNMEMQKYSDLEYYVLRIAPSNSTQDILTIGINNKQEYYQRAEYYSSDCEQDIRLVTGPDTLQCALFNYVPNYGLAPYIEFLIAFTKNRNEKEKALFDRVLIIDDKIMGNGLIKMEINKDNINKTPSIITF